MAEWLSRWGKFLTESKEPIEEATEEEIEDLDQILHNLDPKDLSFNNIFGDRMRLAVPLDEKSVKSPVEKFLNATGYEVDMKTGIATGYSQRLRDGTRKKLSLTQQRNYIGPDGKVNLENPYLDHLKNNPEKAQEFQRGFRKIQMKVGKLLRKGIDFLEKGNIERYKDFFDENFEVTPASLGWMVPKLKDRLSEWEKRGATKSGYTIVVSRHPLDVFRMSDFDRIQSCHSPPSRDGGGSYYKCAVAEAHGHGLVAYLVRNEDLDDEIETKELKGGDYQTLLDQYQENDEEFFYDDHRNEGDITPINRVRIRKYASPEFGMTIAVPDQVVYGDKGLGDPLVGTLRNWSKETQEDVFKKIADTPEMFRNDKLNLNKWVQHGGTYKDTDQGVLMKSTLGHETTGYMRVDDTTENSLELTTGIAAVEEQAEDMIRAFNRRSYSVRVRLRQIEVEDGQFFIPIQAEMMVKIDEDDFVSPVYSGGIPDAIRGGIAPYLEEYGLPVGGEYDTVSYYATRGKVEIAIPLDIESVTGELLAYSLNALEHMLEALDREDDKHETYEELTAAALRQEGALKGSGLQQFAQMVNDNTYYEWDITIDDDYNPEDITAATNTYVNLDDLIEKIPVKLDRNPAISSMVKVLFDGSEVAEVGGVYDGEGNLESLEIISDEFESKKLGGFKNFDEVREYAQFEIAKMIVAYGTRMGGYRESSRDFHIAVKNEMRVAAGGVDGEWSYPRSRMIASSSPDSDSEWKMIYEIQLYEDDSEGQLESAEKLINDVDDEDVLREVFRLAFAKVAKVPMATNENVRQYFRKFNLY